MKKISVASSLRIRTYDETCSIHKGTHLMGFDNQVSICPKCEQEKIEQEKRQKIDAFKDQSIRGVLRRKSLVDDNDTFKFSFKSYEAKNGTLEYKNKQLARKIAGEYFQYPNREFNSVLLGTPGAGKTHLAMSMLRAVNENAEPAQKCLFINAETVFGKIKASFDNSSEWWTPENTINLLTSVDLLVLDDLGSESSMRMQSDSASNFVQDTLKKILNKQKRVIITTNLRSDQLTQVYNPKLVSRMLRGSAGHVIDFNGIKDKRVTGL